MAGCITYDEELPYQVSPHRMFHALFEDAHNLWPKILPNIVKSVDFVSGDGSSGSIQQINFVEGGPVKYAKNRLDSKDKDKFEIKYTVIECDEFGDQIDHIYNDVKFEAAPGGGCICKSKSTYYPKAGAVLNEEKIKAAIEDHHGVNKFIENYLVENPEVYA